MADDAKPTVAQQNPTVTKPPVNAAVAAAAVQPELEAVAEEMKLDEAPPGGKYIVGDRFVDANGNDLGEAPKKK